MQLPMTRNHQFHRAGDNTAAQTTVGGRCLAHHTHGIDELHRMHLRQRLFVDFTAVFGKNTTQDIGSRLGYAPVLVADNVGQALEEGDRGVGIEQPAFELTPIAAMQVLGDKDAALHYAREIQCERFDDVARQMGAVIDDDVELWRALEHLLAHIGSIGIADDDGDARVVVAEAPAVRIDVATNQGCCIAEIL